MAMVSFQFQGLSFKNVYKGQMGRPLATELIECLLV